MRQTSVGYPDEESLVPPFRGLTVSSSARRRLLLGLAGLVALCLLINRTLDDTVLGTKDEDSALLDQPRLRFNDSQSPFGGLFDSARPVGQSGNVQDVEDDRPRRPDRKSLRPASFNLRLLHQRFIDKLRKGEPCIVGLLGGSISFGNGLERGQTTYAQMFVQWLNDNFPVEARHGKQHVLWNHAQTGSGSDLASLCMQHFFRQEIEEDGTPDLVLLDFAVNDERNMAPPFRVSEQSVFDSIHTDPPINLEQIVRQLLHWRTASIMIEFPTFRNYKDGNYIDAEWRNGKAIHGAGTQHLAVAEWYGVPYVDVAGEYLNWASPSTLPLFFKDHLHPRWPGHAFASYLLVSAFKRQLDLQKPPIEGGIPPRERTKEEAYRHINTLNRASSRPYAQIYPWDGIEHEEAIRPGPLAFETSREARLFSHAEPESRQWTCSIATIRDRYGHFLHDIKPVFDDGWTYGEDPPKTNKWGWTTERVGTRLSFEVDPISTDVAVVYLKSSLPVGAAYAWLSGEENPQASWSDLDGTQRTLLDGSWKSPSKQVAVAALSIPQNRKFDHLYLHIETIDPDSASIKDRLLDMGSRSKYFKVVGYLTSAMNEEGV